jgi:hypothetical protein
MTEDVLFIVCITKIKDNLRIMNEFKQLLLKRKHLFSYIDAMFMMYFLYLGHQNEEYLKYIKTYSRKVYTYPLLLTT